MMDKYGLDGLIATSAENNFYVSDIQSLTKQYLRDALFFSVIPRDTKPAIVMPFSDVDIFFMKSSRVKDIRCYGEFFINFTEKTEKLTESEKRFIELYQKIERETTAVDALVNILREKGLDEKILGIDESGMPYKVWETIKKKLHEAKLIEASSIFKDIRMVKTENEIKMLRKAVEITENAVNTAFGIAKEGITEADLFMKFHHVIIKEGAKPFLAIFGCGFRSAFPNALPTNYKLKKGDIIRFDGGCIYEGYYCDIAKNAVYGQPNEKLKKYYSAVLQGAVNAINEIKPGVEASQLYSLAVRSVKEAGIPHYRRHHCGHGIGLECYEIPIINEKDHTALEDGAVINIETPYYEIGFGGVQVEETVLVTKKGFQYLSRPVKELLILK